MVQHIVLLVEQSVRNISACKYHTFRLVYSFVLLSGVSPEAAM